MAMNKDELLSDAELDGLFEAARDTMPAPSQELWEKVHQDALLMMPNPREIPVAPSRSPSLTAGIVTAIVAAIGGWFSIAGLATAALAGIWIGLVNPQALRDSPLASLLPGSSFSETFDLEDLEPGFGGLNAIYEEG